MVKTSFNDKISSKPVISDLGMKTVCNSVLGLVWIAGALLSMNNRLIPAYDGDSDGDFYIPRHTQNWPRNREKGPRISAVAVAGYKGTSSHVILEESPDTVEGLYPDFSRFTLFCVEGDTQREILERLHELEELAGTWPSGIRELSLEWFDKNPPDRGRKLALTMISGDLGDFNRQIPLVREYLEKNPDTPINIGSKTIIPGVLPDTVFHDPAPIAGDGRIALVFPGSGNNYPGMGRDLALMWPDVMRRQDGENLTLSDQLNPSYFWNEDTLKDPLNNNGLQMVGHVAFGSIVHDVLERMELKPSVIIGYSLGESTSLFATRAWKERDEMLRRINNRPLFMNLLSYPYETAGKAWNLPPGVPAPWGMYLLGCPAEKAESAIENAERCYLLIRNSPSECVVGGDLNELKPLVKGIGCSYFQLEGVTTAHCGIVKLVEDEYRDFHTFRTTPPAGIDYYSMGTGDRYIPSDESCAENILQQCVRSIDFPALIEKVYADGVRVFVETGPGGSCSRMINDILGDRPHLACSASMPGQGEVLSMMKLCAILTAERIGINPESFFKNIGKCQIDKRPARILSFPVGRGGFILKKCSTEELKNVPSPFQFPEPVSTAVDVPPIEIKRDMPSIPALNDPVYEGYHRSQMALLQAQESFLRFSGLVGETLARNMEFQMSLISRLGGCLEMPDVTIPCVSVAVEEKLLTCGKGSGIHVFGPVPLKQKENLFMDRAMCMEFAVGSVGAVLGKRYASADTYPTRVRLPDEPLMLVDRILTVEGEPLSLTSGRVVTEHDVLPGAWYLDCGRIPTCMAVEAGQADLFLSGYLGIDMKTRGEAVYRLLDAVVTFHGPLPTPGAVIKYDIRIIRFFRQGDTYLFKFEFDSTVNGKPLLTMRDGCAGFFTPYELDNGRGVVHTKLDLCPMQGKLPSDWEYPVELRSEAYSDEQIDALRRGDLSACFGPEFEGLNLKKPVTIPGGKMKLVDRIQYLQPKGGRFSLGQICGEADISPDDWFLTCHFCDDNVMPGTLMYECCMHTLRIFLIRMGWIGEEGECVWEPVPGVQSGLKCRGQVIDSTRRATYRISIREMGYAPEPYAIADALMYADGRPIVEITSMSIRLSGYNRKKIEDLWKNRKPINISPVESANEKSAPIFDRDRITAFAVGKPSDAFGKPYEIFDNDRVIARLPGPPYQFLDRITHIKAEPWMMESGGEVVAQYDIPSDEWYFSANRQKEMPFAVLLEVALQPCGWLAGYMGSALHGGETDLSFRNLGGNAVQYRHVNAGSGILTTRVRVTGVSKSGGMIIQNYDFEVFNGSDMVYRGDTYFGFFSKTALANQLGITGVEVYQPPADMGNGVFDFPVFPPFPEKDFAMIHQVEIYSPHGGPFGLGFIRGTFDVDVSAWFFKAHFYQDPVIPGSLGLESMIQLMKYFAYRRWGKEGELMEFETPVRGMRHEWVYRGQVIPKNRLVTVDMHVKSVSDMGRTIIADGFLMVDGLVIYGMKDFSLRV